MKFDFKINAGHSDLLVSFYCQRAFQASCAVLQQHLLFFLTFLCLGLWKAAVGHIAFCCDVSL